MKYNLQYIPNVNAAAGVLNSCFAGRERILAVDHLTIHSVDPNDWDLVFVLCAETTFKIRPELDRLGSKAVLVHTSSEPGLKKYKNFFFPHWLFCIFDANKQNMVNPGKGGLPSHVYNALLGRAKDNRTRLLQELEKKNLIDQGIISYHPGNFYGPKLELDSTPYHSNVWEYEENEIKILYSNDLNYRVRLDSTTRLVNGHFSSCVIPWRIYEDSMISVVAETDHNGTHCFITEKTWKPFIGMHPVIFYATPSHEEFLESIGFEMYIKTNGDPEKVATVVNDIAYGGWGDYTYRNWNSIAAHNRRFANDDWWRNKFHSWLHDNFVN